MLASGDLAKVENVSQCTGSSCREGNTRAWPKGLISHGVHSFFFLQIFFFKSIELVLMPNSNIMLSSDMLTVVQQTAPPQATENRAANTKWESSDVQTLETALIFNIVDSCGWVCVNGHLCVSMCSLACISECIPQVSFPDQGLHGLSSMKRSWQPISSH